MTDNIFHQASNICECVLSLPNKSTKENSLASGLRSGKITFFLCSFNSNEIGNAIHHLHCQTYTEGMRHRLIHHGKVSRWLAGGVFLIRNFTIPVLNQSVFRTNDKFRFEGSDIKITFVPNMRKTGIVKSILYVITPSEVGASAISD